MPPRFTEHHAIVLDAMGVIFDAADDVAELLIPFIAQRDGSADHALICETYREASLGAIDADELWRRVGLGPAVEDDYLSLHRTRAGLSDFVARVCARRIPLWCLSNDVARWSRKLRARHGLDAAFSGAVMSGEVGARKPSAAIFRVLLDRVDCAPEQSLFVDDRDANVAAARRLGIDARPFTRFDAITTDSSP
jgi:putative hydrolase of the HAD superfamily